MSIIISTDYINVRFEDGFISSDAPMNPCGFNPPSVLTDTPTSILSPNYPNPYQNRLFCQWYVAVSSELLITIAFTNLDLEEG